MSKSACIIVTTPFQMISSLSIVEQFNEYEFDLYIISNFKSAKELEEAIYKEKIFNNVRRYSLYDIRKYHKETPNKKERILRTLGRQWAYLNYISIGKKIAVPDKCYDAVFFAAAHSSMELLMYFQKKYSPKFYLYDDGVMTYRCPGVNLGEDEKFSLVKNLIFKQIGSIRATKLVYMPELYTKMHPDEILPERLVKTSVGMQEIEKHIFHVSEDDIITADVIILECVKKQYLNDIEGEQLERIYDILLEKLNKKKIVFKKHPRDKEAMKEYRKYITTKIPFETINCIQNIESKILIAWDSTAVLTSKLFYNQEPVVILLYKLAKGKMNNMEETDYLYQNFKECYENKNRFLIPESLDELNRFLEVLNRE